MAKKSTQKVVVIGAGPVGALAALYAAGRGYDVEVYELRGGMLLSFLTLFAPTSEYKNASMQNPLENPPCIQYGSQSNG